MRPLHALLAPLALLLLGAGAIALPRAAHPNSLSSSRILVRGASIELELRCQVLSLLEVIDGLDADGDEHVTRAEVQGSSDAILAYVGDHYRLTVGTDRESRGGMRLEPRPVSVSLDRLDAALAPELRDWVDVRLRFEAEEPVRDVATELSLFLDTSPDHLDITTVEWEGGASRVFTLAATDPRMRFDPEGRGAFGAFVRLGVDHILSGWDHIAFLVLLVLGARRLRSLTLVVTAFTLAHSVTLALVSLEVLDVSGVADYVEATIALSIAYVAADNLLHADRRRGHGVEAFVFGLVHGLGFAGFLGASLLREEAKGLALFGFNVGVELGQLAIVLALALVLHVLFGRGRGGSEAASHLAPPWMRRAGSAAVGLLGLWWFFERI